MPSISSLPCVRTFLLLLTVLMTPPALGGISYNLAQSHASASETVRIDAVMFNDTESTMDWTPPEQLILQWRSPSGNVTRSVAYLDTTPGQRSVPVNTFVKLAWRAIVPTGLNGLQAINIEGETTLLALGTSPLENSQVVGTTAVSPVVDAGAATSLRDKSDPPLPESIVAAIGASPRQGPTATGQQPVSTSQLSGFDRFRNAISPYEPVYFVGGSDKGRNARYQISFKYRLFTPDDPSNPSLADNLYLGYTQTALWDLHSNSNPFVDTSYKPSIFWRKDALLQTENTQWFLGLATGVEHESNGKAGDDSRSINHAYIQPEFNYRFNGGSTLTFAPRLKSYFHVRDNPDYRDYAGNVDWKLRWAQDNGLVLTGQYRHGRHSRSTTQLDAAWPLRRTPLNMNGYLYFQYFQGYGQTLLGYDHKSGSQFRIGLSLVP